MRPKEALTGLFCYDVVMTGNEEVIAAWQEYLDTISDWRQLVRDIDPKKGGCGWVYELPNPIERPNESFAIADMRDLEISEPHYHTNGETEIYFVIQGLGKMVVGGAERDVATGSIVVTAPETAHFTVPHADLVLAVINTPPFRAENYVVVTDTLPIVGFDRGQYDRLTPKNSIPQPNRL